MVQIPCISTAEPGTEQVPDALHTNYDAWNLSTSYRILPRDEISLDRISSLFSSEGAGSRTFGSGNSSTDTGVVVDRDKTVVGDGSMSLEEC